MTLFPAQPLHRILAAGLGLIALLPLTAAPVAEWRHTTFEDFSSGTPGHAGQNLHVSRDGRLQTIRRYDLDGNGHLDLLYNSTHDWYHPLPISVATAAAGGAVKVERLQVEGSQRILVNDLNRDGFPDLLIAPNRQNLQHGRTQLAIAWGAADGWSHRRLTRQLPVNGLTQIAVADLDGDGWTDILSLNSTGWLHGQPEGRIVRVYWGSKGGFLLNRYHDVGIPDAIDLAAVNFGGTARAAVLAGNGTLHLLAARTEDGHRRLHAAATVGLPAKDPTCLLWQPDGGGRLWIGTKGNVLLGYHPQHGVTALPAVPATHLALGRLDADEWPDLVLTNLKLGQAMGGEAVGAATGAVSAVTILWGAESGPDHARRLDLAIPQAIGTAIGDLDGDGHAELLVAVHQGDVDMDATSRIYRGDGTRTLAEKFASVPTQGARDIALAAHPAGHAVAFFANSLQGMLGEAVPLRLFWGAADGFRPERMSEIPMRSGYKSSVSDLNNDGYPDLVTINSGHAGPEAAARDTELGAHIYWGGPEGAIAGPGPNRFDLARRQILREPDLGSINVADLNRDGYLDLVLGAFEGRDGSSQLVIYYGSAEGFLPANRVAVPVPSYSIGALIADFNGDSWLDITVASLNSDQVITHWGGPHGYSADRRHTLSTPAPIEVETADLDGDGHLDLLVGSYFDRVAKRHDTGTTVFWGAPDGWRESNAQWLPGMTPIGLAVADLDGDGHLDIVSPHYHGELSRERLPCYIYWGGPDGYNPLNRTALIADSADDVMIADFNGDGRPDLAFSSHSTDFGHLTQSPIYFNDGQRFANPTVQYLPTRGPHWMWVQDPGNIYDRRHREKFTSAPLAWSQPATAGSVAVTATTPHGARVAVAVRSAANAEALARAPWQEAAAGRFTTAGTDRVLQYRLILHSANGDAYPVVSEVRLSLR
ncbi:MAG: VCBS repeat-containing protein [Opitutaceae bacterium]|nr:VCBS repeat-containing protein [Opitutaceae bacterium]